MEFTQNIVNESDSDDEYEIKVNILKLPEFLINSKLFEEKYKTKVESKEKLNEVIEYFSSKNYIESCQVDNVRDLERLIKVLDYWDVNETPFSVYESVVKINNIDKELHDYSKKNRGPFIEIFDKYKDSKIVKEIMVLAEKNPWKDIEVEEDSDDSVSSIDSYEKSMMGPYMREKDMLVYMPVSKRRSMIDESTEDTKQRVSNACCKGYVNLLKFFYSRDPYFFDDNNIVEAASSENLECIEYIRSKLED